jgi:hypothetical protein
VGIGPDDTAPAYLVNGLVHLVDTYLVGLVHLPGRATWSTAWWNKCHAPSK